MKKETDPFLAEAKQVAFSEERHARLVDSLKSAPSRAVEVPLARSSPWPIVTGLAATAALSAFMWIQRPERVPTEVGRLGGTVLLQNAYLRTSKPRRVIWINPRPPSRCLSPPPM